MSPWRSVVGMAGRAVAGFVLAAALASAVLAQGVPCNGPTQGNCVAVVQFPTSSAIPAGGGAAGYPPGSTPVTANASGSTGAVAATLPAAAGKVTYLCGVYVTGTTSTTANATAVTAVSSATTLFSSLIAHPVTPSLGTLAPPPFGPCLAGAAQNTSIVVTSAADAAGSNVTVNAWGYQQ